MKQKANTSIGFKASNATIGCDLGYDLDLEFSRSISQPKVVRFPRNEKQTYQFYSRPQMSPMGLTLAMTLSFEFSRSNVTMTCDHRHGLNKDFHGQILE